jgi:8-oxo-dGTP pyrophosphatase MutT (NUDIX family)
MGERGGNPWRTVRSTVVYRNPWMTVREDDVIRPDGTDGVYGVVEIPASCGVVAIDDGGRVALVGQWRYVHDRFSLEIPTGGSESGEAPLDAARRELREETGLTAGTWTSLGSVDNSNGVTTDVAHMFLATGLTTGVATGDTAEPVELTWVPFGDAVRSVLAGEITESVSVAAILKAHLL